MECFTFAGQSELYQTGWWSDLKLTLPLISWWGVRSGAQFRPKQAIKLYKKQLILINWRYVFRAILNSNMSKSTDSYFHFMKSSYLSFSLSKHGVSQD